jgi:hypothetical protein
VARATSTIKGEVKKQPVPAAPVAPKTQKDYIQELIDACIKSFGALTGNDADDKVLMDWLVKEYRKGL